MIHPTVPGQGCDARSPHRYAEWIEISGYWTGRTATDDLRALLDAAELEPPYVLLGASFGGVIAHLFAGTYPDDVAGIVMLDSMVPNEIELDILLPPEDRFRYGEDIGSNEGLDHYAALHEALAVPVPDIPLSFMFATRESRMLDVPAFDALIMDVMRAYVDTYDPGSWVEVDSPHFMEQAVPDAIVEQLHNLMDVITACTEIPEDALCTV